VRSALTVGRRRRAVHLTSVHAATYKGCTDAISSIRSNDHAKYANRMYSRGPGDVRAPIRSLESSCTSGILRAVLHTTVRAATYQDRIEATRNTGSNDHGTYASHKYSPRLGAFYVPTRCTDGSCTSGFLGVVLRNAADREASNSPGINAMSMARKKLATKVQESLGAVCLLIRTLPNSRTSVRC
jgi:hypothetical protein